MTDVVVTVPARLWHEWVQEGDAAGEDATGDEYVFSVPTRPARLYPGDRVYVVAGGRLRGFAPLVRVDLWYDPTARRTRYLLVRAGAAQAVTIDRAVEGFRGFRYRWWSREDEQPFPDWRAL